MPMRRWNLADFECLLRSPDVPAEELLVSLASRRRARDVEHMRYAVHAWHQPLHAIASEALLYDSHSRLLSRLRGTLVCAICGERY